MSPRKLSDGDRQEILELYRNTEETTSTLAVRFGVSSSTISRFLKISLSELEYEDLIQEKRLARTTKVSSGNDSLTQLTFIPKEESPSLEIVIDTEEDIIIETERIETIKEENLSSDLNINKPILKNTKKIESELDNYVLETEEELEISPNIFQKSEFSEKIISYTEIETETIIDDEELEEQLEPENDIESVNALAAMFGEAMEEDEDDDDDDDDDDDEIQLVVKKNVSTEQLQVLPLAKAIFPRVCYLVIDRYSELITKPLREFADLGKIPAPETGQRTLPVFDNHRVAKRFCDAKSTHSTRKGKVIKVPDGRILQKTSSFLQAKGISRILIDGKIYSLV
ncbi:transposase [Geminocystis sp.]|uniref:transposase n=1 Tax=Geminocystis sp. TaxID=2664100 RepID=UPI003593BEFC